MYTVDCRVKGRAGLATMFEVVSSDNVIRHAKILNKFLLGVK